MELLPKAEPLKGQYWSQEDRQMFHMLTANEVWVCINDRERIEPAASNAE